MIESIIEIFSKNKILYTYSEKGYVNAAEWNNDRKQGPCLKIVIYWKEKEKSQSLYTIIWTDGPYRRPNSKLFKQNFHHRNFVKTSIPSDSVAFTLAWYNWNLDNKLLGKFSLRKILA